MEEQTPGRPEGGRGFHLWENDTSGHASYWFLKFQERKIEDTYRYSGPKSGAKYIYVCSFSSVWNAKKPVKVRVPIYHFPGEIKTLLFFLPCSCARQKKKRHKTKNWRVRTGYISPGVSSKKVQSIPGYAGFADLLPLLLRSPSCRKTATNIQNRYKWSGFRDKRSVSRDVRMEANFRRQIVWNILQSESIMT